MFKCSHWAQSEHEPKNLDDFVNFGQIILHSLTKHDGAFQK